MMSLTLVGAGAVLMFHLPIVHAIAMAVGHRA